MKVQALLTLANGALWKQLTEETTLTEVFSDFDQNAQIVGDYRQNSNVMENCNYHCTYLYWPKLVLPLSYVYGTNSMVRDDGATGDCNDWVLPTAADLQSQTFLNNPQLLALPYPQQQKMRWKLIFKMINTCVTIRGEVC